jgi:hypothetical protein
VRQKVIIWVGAALAAVGLFFAYLRMARSVPINTDAASNALQGWDIFHGNPLLHGWVLSDVSFYPTELVQFGLVQLVTGVNVDQVNIAAAITYTMIVVLAAVVARGRATGLEAWLRAGVAVALLVLPAPGIGYATLIANPNHTGTAVPLLLTWLVVDRVRHRVWAPVLVAVLLGWGAAGDPLVTFVGAVPLAVVCAYRALRERDGERRHELALVLAAAASVALSRGFHALVGSLGGFESPHPPIELSPVADWPHRAWMTLKMIGIILGTHRPEWYPGWLEGPLSLLHLVGVLAGLAAVLVTVRRVLRGGADRVDSILVAAIACDLGAEVVSTISSDLYAAREISPVASMTAVLAARVAGPWLAAAGAQRWRAAGRYTLWGILTVYAVTLVVWSPPRADPAEGQAVAEFLRSRQLTYGVGAYWASNNITVATERAVTVVPVVATADGVGPFCWQAKDTMYDPARHDARFLVIEKRRLEQVDAEDAEREWGAPVERHDLDGYIVLVYDRNLLAGLPPLC